MDHVIKQHDLIYMTRTVPSDSTTLFSRAHKTSSKYMMSHEQAVVERKDQNCIEYILYCIIQLGEKPGEITVNT